MNFEIGEIWYANFPLEEDPSIYIKRPIIIADICLPNILAIKVTKHKPRINDQYDTSIMKYREAGLKLPSTARISKIVIINVSQISSRKGKLHPLDYNLIFNKLNEFSESE